MNHDGSGQTQLTTGSQSAEDADPAFSPDGARIAFTHYTASGSQIWVMNADGSGQTQLTFEGAGPDYALAPAFSPDGRRIAYSRRSASGLRDLRP